MASNVWTLTDVDSDVYVEEMEISPDNVELAATGLSIKKRRLQGGLRDGVDVVEVDNGAFRFTVVPTRGMGVWKAAMGDVELGWRSPVRGPVHPAFVPVAEASGLGWLDGFDEMMVRCGLESNGAPEFNDDGTVRYGLHGKIANIPARKVEVSVEGDTGQIAVMGVVDETRLFFNKLRMTTVYKTSVDQPGMTISDTITNISAEPSELELLYHTNFGLPFLNPGSKVVLPVKKIAPRDAEAVGNLAEWDTYGPETPGSAEAVFFFDLAADAEGRTQAVLRNAAGDRGVSLRFNKSQLPCFTLWKSRQAAADGYVTGLEPAINFPNARSFEKEKGRVAVLAPGESRSFEITMEVHPDAASVVAAEAAVAQIQKGTEPEILARPNPEWSKG
ncbi:MAG: aldose 1-epimerase family protein [Planctomycetes bacterium]|nr:aldose 1-epimerase family protein [Planctomycetota bacterium]